VCCLEQGRGLSYLRSNNTRQGYARKCTLKLAGYSFYGGAVTKIPFVKPALSIAQKVELLRTRGMKIGDDARAAFYPQYLNHYRPGAYSLPISRLVDLSSSPEHTGFALCRGQKTHEKRTSNPLPNALRPRQSA
jgi:hypothetical protein